MIKFTFDKFSNGLQLLTVPLKQTKAVTVLVLVRAGARYEEKKTNGISHFLEHMLFKGTRKRPTAFDLSSELDGLGAQYNAFTSYEYTGFYITSASQHFNQSLDILCDMFFNSRFESEEIEREKGVIAEEIKMYHDLPPDHVQSIHQNLLYGDNPLGRDIAGSIDIVNGFSRDHFVNYLKNYYQAQNITIVIAGNPGRIQWVKIAKDYLSSIEKGKIAKIERIRIDQKSPKVKIEKRDTDQAHLVFSFRAFHRTDPRRPILAILNNVLGSTMSSRLFIEIRERRGLAYYIHSDLDEFADYGSLNISAGIQTSSLEEAVKIILHQLDRLRNEKVLDKELRKAKENLKGRMAIGLESSMAIASFLGEQLLLKGKIKQAEELSKELDAVSADQIKVLAKELIKPKALNLAVIGPYPAQEEKKLQNKLVKLV